MTDAEKNLRENQRQLDADGVMVGVSRQAIDEVLAETDRLRAALETIANGGVSQQEYVMLGPMAYMRIARAALKPTE